MSPTRQSNPKFIDSCQGKRFNQPTCNTRPILINLGSPFFADKTPLERTKSLESEDLLEIIHAAATASSQTAVLMDTDLHFTCFVQAPEASTREADPDG